MASSSFNSHSGNTYMSELFPDDYSIETERYVTKGIEKFCPKITPEMLAEIEALYSLNIAPTFLISERTKVGKDRENMISRNGKRLQSYNLYMTEFTLIKNTEKNRRDELFRLALFFMIEFNKRVHRFNDAITIRVQTSPVNYYNVATLKNKFNINLDTIVNFLQHVENDYQTVETNYLKFIIIESAGIKGKGNGNFNINTSSIFKQNNLEKRRFLFNPQYVGYCGCISIIYGSIKQNFINTIITNKNGLKLIRKIKNIDYRSNKNFVILYTLGKLLADELQLKDEMTLFDFDKITEKYNELKIVIFNGPDKLLYISGNIYTHDPHTNSKNMRCNKYIIKHTLYLQYSYNHFQYIKDIDAFSRLGNKRRIHCKLCEYIFKESEFKKHSCVKQVCKKCKRVLFTIDEMESHKQINSLTCCKCKISFNETCYSEHLTKLCYKYQNYTKCDTCNIIYNKITQHICYTKYCNICMIVKPIYHRCYMTPITINTQSNNTYHEYYVYDIESFLDPQNNNNISVDHNIALIICSTLYNFQPIHFRDPIKFIEFLESFNKTTYFYAHNGKSYDSVLILHELYKNGKRPDKLIKRGNKIILMKYRNIIFLDSINHINGSLRDIVNSLGIPKLTQLEQNILHSKNKGYFPYKFFTELNKDYEGDLPDKSYFELDVRNSYEFKSWCDLFDNKIYNIMNECIKYCEQDVLLLCLILRNYRDENITINNIDPLIFPTISSYAMYVYRMQYLEPNTIGILNTDEHKFAQKGFYGGRTNSLVLHKKWNRNNPDSYGLYMDVNSLYPAVQYYDKLPIGHPIIINNIDDAPDNVNFTESYALSDLINIINDTDKYCLVECDVTCPKNLYIPVLVNKVNNKLMSTLYDKERIVYSSPELRLALKKGYVITKIYKMHMYHTYDGLFKKYIDKFIKIKEESRLNNDSYRTKISKLMLCSIWGKLAQKRDLPKHSHAVNEAEWNHVMSEHMKNIIEIEDFYIVEDYMYYKYKELNSHVTHSTTNIALAGAITSYARCRLYEELDKLNTRVLYFDTDSIIY